MVDAEDSKSSALKSVRVRVSPRAPSDPDTAGFFVL